MIPGKLGKYQVLQELGRGSTGVVYLAVDPFLKRQVALKQAHPELLSHPHHGERFRHLFLNEASLAGRLVHPHIVAVHDAEVDGDSGYIVMEYVPGGTLAQHATVERLLPVERVVEHIYKCCNALDFAHSHGLIHRDIKPANVLLTDDGQVKISDFGTAFFLASDVTQIAGAVGSPAYMAPEQVMEQALSAQSDMFSLGVMTFQLLTGRLPFHADNYLALTRKLVSEPAPRVEALRPEVPASLAAIVARALEKDPQARYSNWQAFADELGGVFRHIERTVEIIGESEKFQSLKRLSFFDDFSDNELWEVARITRWRRLGENIALTREGNIGDSFFVIAEGEVHVTKGGRLLTTLGPGDSFGEMAFLNPRRCVRSASVTSATPVLLIKFRRDSVAHASERVQARLNQVFLRMLVERLSFASQQLALP